MIEATKGLLSSEQMFEENGSWIDIVIGTYGDLSWHTRACDLLAYTAETQTVKPLCIYAIHASTLAEARNHGAENAPGAYLIFLDADDRLDPEFCKHMKIAGGGMTQIVRPSIRGFRGDEWLDEYPLMFEKHPLLNRNYLPIGSMVPKGLFTQVGGFDEWECLEDWAFWLKCVTQGNATIGDRPEATYLINDEHTRNRHPDIDQIANKIRDRYRWSYFQSQEYQDGLALNPVRDH